MESGKSSYLAEAGSSPSPSTATVFDIIIVGGGTAGASPNNHSSTSFTNSLTNVQAVLLPLGCMLYYHPSLLQSSNEVLT